MLDNAWSVSLAVGTQGLTENVQTLLGTKATNKKVIEMLADHALREQPTLYGLGAENIDLQLNNSFFGYFIINSMSYLGPTLSMYLLHSLEAK